MSRPSNDRGRELVEEALLANLLLDHMVDSRGPLLERIGEGRLPETASVTSFRLEGQLGLAERPRLRRDVGGPRALSLLREVLCKDASQILLEVLAVTVDMHFPAGGAVLFHSPAEGLSSLLRKH